MLAQTRRMLGRAKRRLGGRLKKVAKVAGYSEINWLRVRQIDRWQRFFAERAPLGDLLEISPGWNQAWRRQLCRSYTSVDYPEFDICVSALDRTFDIVIADQVLEHVAVPRHAVANIAAMLKPGGYAMIATPFLFRVHARPNDFCRWTEQGLKRLLVDGGFPEEDIIVESWGNKSCARAHIGGPVRDYGFGRSLKNDPEYPIMVWAFARRP